ncbi:MAG TPA: hypothetical protein VGD26_09380 [Chitinophagaceae bacterium]
MAQLRLHITPQSYPGKWSVYLVLALMISFLFFRLLAEIPLIHQPSESFFNHVGLTLQALFIIGAGIGAFWTGITAMIKDGEKSLLVLISTLIGLVIFIYSIEELFWL